MTLYTTMPLEAVLQGYNTEYTNLVEMQWQGRTLLVERISVSEVRIERLVQAVCMNDYLDEAYQPGKIMPIN
ncbi:YlzJ-like family protein [Paenibacillus marinisediminis]